MESPFEEVAPNRTLYAVTMANARMLHQQREDEIKAETKLDRDEELSAMCRLLNL